MKEANIVYMLFGSHLYSLNTPTSDKDYKGIYLPEMDNILLGNYSKTLSFNTGNDKTKNTPDDVDCEIIALPTFIKHACDGETFALDMLHCKSPISTSDIWQDLMENRSAFYSKNMKAYIGYVKTQAAKYGIKGSRLADIRKAIDFFEKYVEQGIGKTLLSQIRKEIFPTGEYIQWTKYTGKGAGKVEQDFYEVNAKKYQSTNTVEYVLEQLTKMYDGYGARAKLAEDNEGIDWKAISHALRAGYQARDIYKDGDFEYPLKETDFIMSVKKGELDFKTDVSPVLEELVKEVELLADKSFFPDKVDREYWDQWLLNVYRNKIIGWW
jgi:hypothetical protein